MSRLESIINHYIIFILSVALWPFLSNFGIGFLDSLLKYIAMFFIYLLMLIMLYKDKGKKNLAVALYNLKYITIITIIVILSTMWSINKNNTFQQSIQLILTTIYSVYLYLNYSAQQIIAMITKVILVIGILSILTVILFPDYGMMMYPNWNGLYSQKNTLGRMMVIGIITTYYYIQSLKNKKNLLAYTTFLICLINLIFSGSTTSIVSLFLIFIIIRYVKFKHKFKSFIFFMLIILGGYLFIVNAHLFSSIFEFLNKDISFTGRTDIWQIAIERIKESIHLGYGYNAAWNKEYMEQFIYYENYMTNAHNGVLELILEIGIYGTAIYITLFIVTLVKTSVFFNKIDKVEFWFFPILIYILISNFSEALTIQSFSIIWVIQIIAILSVNTNSNRTNKIKKS